MLVNYLIRSYGWRRFGNCGSGTDGSFVPVGIWVTRSTPEEIWLAARCRNRERSFRRCFRYNGIVWSGGSGSHEKFLADFVWVDTGIGAIGAVIQHFILFLKDQGYSSAVAARFSAGLLVASLAEEFWSGTAWIL